MNTHSEPAHRRTDGPAAASAAAYLDLRRALALHRQGQAAQAQTLYQQVLQVLPDQPDALYLSGLIHAQQERHDIAAALFRRAIANTSADPPQQAAAHYALGKALASLHMHAEAIGHFDAALRRMPDHAEAHFRRGNALRQCGRNAEAALSFEQAIRLRSDQPDAFYNCANALLDLGRPEEAVRRYDAALRLKPDFVGALNNRATALRELKRLDDALADYESALRLQPREPALHSNHAAVLRELDRPEEAIAACEAALRLAPAHSDAWNNLGNAIVDLNWYRMSIAAYENGLRCSPDDAGMRWSRSLCQLALGDFEQGWQGYEWRWQTERMKHRRRHFVQPLWLGKEDPAGATVLLHAEQGFGDTIQFCRYATRLAARGATVLLEVQSDLQPLLAGLPGVTRTLPRDAPLPAFDYHAPLLSMPLAFGTTLDTIPAAPFYIEAEAGRAAAWASRLGRQDRPRVGLAWSGNDVHSNDRHRSIPLAAFIKLMADGAQYVSLHKEIRAADRAVLDAGAAILDCSKALGDFSDTAALIANMDLVIAVDTSVAHLAAAMGKPTWILLPYRPDFRWLLEREDSPWYPSVRLFRQPARGDWASVMSRLRIALGAWMTDALKCEAAG